MIAQATTQAKKVEGTTKAREKLEERAAEQNKRRRLSLQHSEVGDVHPVAAVQDAEEGAAAAEPEAAGGAAADEGDGA